MLDPHLLRSDLETVAHKLTRKKYTLDQAAFSDLEGRRKSIQVQTENLQGERNRISKSIGKAKAQGEDIQPLLQQVNALGEDLKQAETKLHQVQQELDNLLLGIPNLPDASVPEGDSDADNELVLEWGQVPSFDFAPRDHVDLGELHGGMDFERAARLSGAGAR